MSQNNYSVDDIAQLIRDGAYGTDLTEYENLDLVQKFFELNPEDPHLKYLDDDANAMLFPTAVEKEVKQQEQALQTPSSPRAEVEQETDTIGYNNYSLAKQNIRDLGAAEASAGFLKQLEFNIESSLYSMPGAIKGFIGWGANQLGLDDDASILESAEDLRHWGKDIIQEKIDNDIELQALQLWQEDEPVKFLGEDKNFFELDMLKRGFASALPSMIEMSAMSLLGGGISGIGYAYKGARTGIGAIKAFNYARKAGKLQLGQTIAGVSTGVGLEGSETWNTAMEYGEKEGLSTEEAAKLAGTATIIAAPIKGALEYFGFSRMAGAMGLGKVGKRELNRIIAGKTVQNSLIQGGKKGLENSITEGMTEWGQFMTDAMVQKGYEEGFGNNLEEYFTNAKKVVMEEGWSPGARESIFGGILLGGSTGAGGTVRTKLGYNSPEAFAQKIKDIDEAADKKINEKPDKKAFFEDIRKAGYYKAMNRAVAGLSKEQSEKFFDLSEKTYVPKGFDRDGSPSDVENNEDSFEFSSTQDKDVNLVNYLSGLIRTEERKPIGDTSKIKDKKEKYIFDQLQKIDSSEIGTKVLTFLDKGGSRGLDAINKLKPIEKDAIYTIALKQIQKEGGLSSYFNIAEATPLQKELAARSFAKNKKVSYSSDTSSDVGSNTQESIKFEEALTPNELEMIYAGQSNVDDIIDYLTSQNPNKNIDYADVVGQPVDEDAITKALEALSVPMPTTTESKTEVVSEVNLKDIPKVNIPKEKTTLDIIEKLNKEINEEADKVADSESDTELEDSEIMGEIANQSGLTPEQIAEAESLTSKKSETPVEEKADNNVDKFVEEEFKYSKMSLKEAIEDFEAKNKKEKNLVKRLRDSDIERAELFKKNPVSYIKKQISIRESSLKDLKDGKGTETQKELGVEFFEKSIAKDKKLLKELSVKKEPEKQDLSTFGIKWLTDEVYQGLRAYGLDDKEISKITPEKAEGITGIEITPKVEKKTEPKKSKKPPKVEKNTTSDNVIGVSKGKNNPVIEKIKAKLANKAQKPDVKKTKELNKKQEAPKKERKIIKEVKPSETKSPSLASPSNTQSANATSESKAETTPSTSTESIPVTRDRGNKKLVLENGQEIQYNDDQQEGYNKLLDWALVLSKELKGVTSIFSLQGYAGTGKSTLLNDVIANIQEKTGAPVGSIVPTHKAKDVLEKMGNVNVNTFASAFGMTPDGYGGKFKTKKDKDGNYIVSQETLGLSNGYMVIDEASMLDDNQLEQMVEVLASLKIKAILVGDGKQLAPVGQSWSSAFKTKFWVERGIPYYSHELTMVERQAQGNPLFSIYNQLRNSIGKLRSNNGIAFGLGKLVGNPKTRFFENLNEKGEGFSATNEEVVWLNKAVELFTSNEQKKDSNHTVITTGTYKRATELNLKIRNSMKDIDSNAQINVGELMSPSITRGGGQGAPPDVTSGVPFEVIEVEETEKPYQSDGGMVNIEGFNTRVRDGVNEKGENVNERIIFIVKNTTAQQTKQQYMRNSFRSLGKSLGIISKTDANDKNKYYIDSNPDYINIKRGLLKKYNMLKTSSDKDARKSAQKALEDFDAQFIYQGIIAERSNSGEVYFPMNKVELDYGYSIIIHKVQGSTYENVFYDEVGTNNFTFGAMAGLRRDVRDLYGRLETEWDRRVVFNNRDRMAYTAVTRPTKNLYILRSPKHGVHLNQTPKQSPPLANDTVPDKFEYQKKKSTNVPLVSEKPLVMEKILKKLKKDFPQISVEGLDKVLASNGREVVGKALGMLAQWSKSKATLDTVPHEYAHIYLNMYRNQPIVKQGIDKFGNEELADYMGLYYQDRLSGSLKKRVGMWAKQFWLKLKKLIGAKFSDQDVKDYLAGSFYAGQKLGKASVFVENQWDWSNSEAENQPEYQDTLDEDLGFNPADRSTLSFFQREMDIRIVKDDWAVIQELARIQPKFDNFYEQFKEFIQSKYDTKAFEFTGDKRKKFEKWLKQTWHKSASKRPNAETYADYTNSNHLVNIEAIKIFQNGVKKYVGMQGQRYMESQGDDYDGGRKTAVNKKSIPLYGMTSYTDRDGVETIRLSLNDLSKEVEYTDKITKEDKVFWERDLNAQFTTDPYDTFNWSQEDFSDGGMGAVFVASKGGDHSALLFTSRNEESKLFDEGEDKDFFWSEYIKEEIKAGNMTKEHAQDMEDQHIKTNISYGDLYVKHEWWKKVKYPQYLMGTHIGSKAEKGMGVQDHYDRLKIDMNDGYNVRDFGKSSIMTVMAGERNSDGTIEGTYFETADGTQIPSGEFDGALWSSGKWFKKLSQALGEDNLTVIKGMVRNRTETKSNVDYIGVKSIQLRPYSGMKLYEDGNLIATYEGRNVNGTWIDSEGNSFEHLSTTDTSKMTNGKFSTFNKIQVLEKGYQNIILNPSEEKNGAHPVTQGELAMSKALLKTPVGKKLYNAMSNYYEEISDDYADDMYTFITEPSKLIKELKRHISENDIMPELQKFVNIVGDEGFGMNHPSIFKLWKSSIVNKYIKDGMFKLRSRENFKGGNFFYKPFYAPAMGKNFGDLKEGDFVMSAESKSISKLVQQKYQEATGEVLNEPKSIYEGHATYWKKLNEWLLETDESGNYINNVPVLLSRQPVAKITGVVMRNVRGLAMGGHGKTMMLSKDDVLKVFDGDWDGDKGIIQVVDNQELIDAYINFQKSPTFNSLDKVVNLSYFGKRLRGTSLSSGKDVTKTINSINSGKGQIGMITNGRNSLFSMHMKDLSVNINENIYDIFDPTALVVMDYIDMNITDENREEIFEEIYNRNGDSIVYRTKLRGNFIEIKDMNQLREAMLIPESIFHLKTSKQNELSNVLQMAVDDSKFGLLGSFKKHFHVKNVESVDNSRTFDNGFLTSLLFAGYTNAPQVHKTYLEKIKSKFNYSKIRQAYNDQQEQMELEELIDTSVKLRNMEDVNQPQRISDTIIEDIYRAKGIILNAQGTAPAPASNADDIRKFNEINRQLGIDLSQEPKQQPVLEYDFSKTTPQEDLILKLGDKFNNFKPIHENIAIKQNNPFQYSDKNMKAAASIIKSNINQKIKEKMESKFEGEPTIKDAEIGLGFAEEFSKAYYDIFPSNKDEITHDFNEQIDDLRDSWIPIWNKLTPRQQAMSTIRMIQGTTISTERARVNVGKKDAKAFRMNFFPLDFVHPETLRLFLRDWHQLLEKPDFKTVKSLSRQEQKYEQSKGYVLQADISNLTKELLEEKCG